MVDWTDADLTQNKHFNALQQDVDNLKVDIEALGGMLRMLGDEIGGSMMVLQDKLKEHEAFLVQRFGYGITTGAVDDRHESES